MLVPAGCSGLDYVNKRLPIVLTDLTGAFTTEVTYKCAKDSIYKRTISVVW